MEASIMAASIMPASVRASGTTLAAYFEGPFNFMVFGILGVSMQANTWESGAWEADAVEDESWDWTSNEPIAMTGEVTSEVPCEDQYVPRIRTEVHRADLCEACRRFGDCSGLFLDPFIVYSCLRLLDPDADAEGLQWQEIDGAAELTGSSLGRVRLLPHVYEESSVVSSSVNYASSSSRTNTLPSSADDAIRRQYGVN